MQFDIKNLITYSLQGEISHSLPLSSSLSSSTVLSSRSSSLESALTMPGNRRPYCFTILDVCQFRSSLELEGEFGIEWHFGIAVNAWIKIKRWKWIDYKQILTWDLEFVLRFSSAMKDSEWPDVNLSVWHTKWHSCLVSLSHPAVSAAPFLLSSSPLSLTLSSPSSDPSEPSWSWWPRHCMLTREIGDIKYLYWVLIKRTAAQILKSQSLLQFSPGELIFFSWVPPLLSSL